VLFVTVNVMKVDVVPRATETANGLTFRGTLV